MCVDQGWAGSPDPVPEFGSSGVFGDPDPDPGQILAELQISKIATF